MDKSSPYYLGSSGKLLDGEFPWCDLPLGTTYVVSSHYIVYEKVSTSTIHLFNKLDPFTRSEIGVMNPNSRHMCEVIHCNLHRVQRN
jgi:hypothetical protein